VTEYEVKSFIRVISEYFTGVTGEAPRMGLPYVKDGRHESRGYAGMIGISGSRRGGVYFSSGPELLRSLAAHILGGEEADEEMLFDLVGEMTNTIAGNMRETFGSSFNISVPIVVKGAIDDIVMRLKPPVIIIPLEWERQPCQLAIGLE